MKVAVLRKLKLVCNLLILPSKSQSGSSSHSNLRVSRTACQAPALQLDCNGRICRVIKMLHRKSGQARCAGWPCPHYPRHHTACNHFQRRFARFTCISRMSALVRLYALLPWVSSGPSTATKALAMRPTAGRRPGTLVLSSRITSSRHNARVGCTGQ